MKLNQRNIETVLKENSILPIIIPDKIEDAVPLVQALYDGGIKIIEITLRSPIAGEFLKRVMQAFPQMHVGIGTVINKKQIDLAYELGVDFIVTPGLTYNMVNILDKRSDTEIPIVPGVSTVSEIMFGIECGINIFKLFPAEILGGTTYLNSLSSLFPQMKFCPTGGISSDNYLDYLALKNVLCVGGSWITPKSYVEQKRWDKITKLVKKFAKFQKDGK